MDRTQNTVFNNSVGGSKNNIYRSIVEGFQESNVTVNTPLEGGEDTMAMAVLVSSI